MAKKRFTDDLFGLFEEPTPVPAASRAEPETGAPANQEEESVEVDVPTPSPGAKRKLSSKKFTADLDSFLSDSFERENVATPVTLIFKKDHLAELKDQAKKRGMYLKDVVQEMVGKYLEEEG